MSTLVQFETRIWTAGTQAEAEAEGAGEVGEPDATAPELAAGDGAGELDAGGDPELVSAGAPELEATTGPELDAGGGAGELEATTTPELEAGGKAEDSGRSAATIRENMSKMDQPNAAEVRLRRIVV